MKNWWADKKDFLPEYVAAQTRLNKGKIKVVWVNKPEVKTICNYLNKTLTGVPSFGVCHGSRNGTEVK